MGITIPASLIEQTFADALALARGGTSLIAEFEEATEVVGRSRSKTFTPVMGTALLAKAAEPRVDILSLLARSGPSGFSASRIGGIFFEKVSAAGIDARCRSRAFHNNNPFEGEERIGQFPSCRDQAGLRLLISSLNAAQPLAKARALDAFASFLRARERLSTAPAAAPRIAGAISIGAAIGLLDSFVVEASEGGKRGQALLVGCVRAVFDDVESSDKVNDPSFRSPADLVVRDGNGNITIVGEAKQKLVTDSDVLAVCQAAAASGASAVIYAALAPGQGPLGVSREPRERHDVAVQTFESVESLVDASIVWSGEPASTAVPQVLVEFRAAMIDLDVDPETIEDWDERLAAIAPQDE
jgi:hypothetical protein